MSEEFNLSEKRKELSTIDKLSLDIPLDSEGYVYYREEDVKEKIQKARNRLISDNTKLGIKSKSDEISGYSATINWLIDKVFKEEFGNKLTGENNKS